MVLSALPAVQRSSGVTHGYQSAYRVRGDGCHYLLLPGVLPPHLVEQQQSIMLGHLEPYLGNALQPVQQRQVQAGHAGHVNHRASKDAPGSGHVQAVCLFSIGRKSQSKH